MKYGDISGTDLLGIDRVLRRGRGEILEDTEDVLFVRDTVSDAYFLACKNREAGIALLDGYSGAGCDLLAVTDHETGLEAFERYGVVPVQAHEPAGNSIGDDGGEYYMKKTPRAIEMAAKIGCPSITVHPGSANKYEMTKEEFVEKNIAAVKKLLPYAEEYGIEILLENIGFADTPPYRGVYATTAKDLTDIVDAIDHPLLAVNWDVGHAMCNGLDEYEEMKSLGSRIHGLHVHDNMGFKRLCAGERMIDGDMHTAPLMWDADFDAVIRALTDIGYKGTLNFEVNPPKSVRKYAAESPELMRYAREVLLCGDAMLYSIGRLMLEKYNCFEG